MRDIKKRTQTLMQGNESVIKEVTAFHNHKKIDSHRYINKGKFPFSSRNTHKDRKQRAGGSYIKVRQSYRCERDSMTCSGKGYPQLTRERAERAIPTKHWSHCESVTKRTFSIYARHFWCVFFTQFTRTGESIPWSTY